MSEPESKNAGNQRVVAIAIDESEYSKFAYDFYMTNIRKESDKVVLLHSIEVRSILNSSDWYTSPYSFSHEVLMKKLDDEREIIKTKLQNFAHLLQESGIDGTVKSIHAETPGQGICQAAEEIGANIIVIGSRGMGKFRRTLMGSVSDYVLHHAHIPVVICKHVTDDQPGHTHKH